MYLYTQVYTRKHWRKTKLPLYLTEEKDKLKKIVRYLYTPEKTLKKNKDDS